MIYKITNKINNKAYIGWTEKSVEERYARHLLNAKYGSDNYLYKAIRKYGPENFICEFLCDGGSDIEILMIEKYNPEYNMTKGGTGGDMSASPKFQDYWQNRADFSGKNNSMYGKYGEDNPNYGQIRDRTPKISEGQKKNWDNNPERKQLASERVAGKNNPMHGKTPKNSIQVNVNGIKYKSKAEASRTLNKTWYTIEKEMEIYYESH